MREHESRLHGDDFDQRFAEIVAGFADDPMFAPDVLAKPDPQPYAAPSPAAEETPADESSADESSADEAPVARTPEIAKPEVVPPDLVTPDVVTPEEGVGIRTPRAPGVNPPLLPQSIPVWRGATGPTFEEILDAEDDEHFIPAPPAPLPPQEDVHFWAMLIALVGGPLILLWLVVFDPDVGPWWTWLSLSMCAAGFVLLVMRGPKDPEQGPGNGAVV